MSGPGSTIIGRPGARGTARVTIVLLMLVLLAAACGNGDEIDAGADDEGRNTDQTSNDSDNDDEIDDGDGTADPDPDPDNADAGYQLTDSNPDLISAQKAAISSVEPIDDRTLAVRYQNGSEPCSLANVTVTEAETSVTVVLETGLHPNAAAMSCIAQVIDYEIRVELAEPVGDREIVIDSI